MGLLEDTSKVLKERYLANKKELDIKSSKLKERNDERYQPFINKLKAKIKDK